MIYEQFLYEVTIDFNSLYTDFENHLFDGNNIKTFDDYFNETTANEEIMDEIFREARNFGKTKEQFLQDLYRTVKNFDGQIEQRIGQIDDRIQKGGYAKNNLFHVKKTITILEQSISN
ncbi:hypothetical protein [Halalkalibacter urbisdiaboli]|uniref:hypothetical protein n=1 Tax=Halalkalibacter urbisdiaboli TaxID=1960589 RepID=UPI000B43D0ED|nr:hypothetical protein [Halalkalibacter urbisdiaboli]